MCAPFFYSQADLAKAFSSGYEAGHNDTVEGIFSGNGRPDEHDEIAWDWSEEAIRDGSLDRRLNL